MTGATRTFDYIVVGAGTAGCVVAARLSARGSVLLLEAGGLDTDPAVRDVIANPANVIRAIWSEAIARRYWSEPQAGLGRRTMVIQQGTVRGGGSSVNGMIYVRGNRRDYDGWAALGNRGWSFEDVLPRFRRSERFAGGVDPYHGVDGSLDVAPNRSPSAAALAFIDAAREVFPDSAPDWDFNGARQERAAALYQVNVTLLGRRASAASAFLDGAADRTALSVTAGARVTRILIEHGRAVGVECMLGVGAETYRAEREVILSAGAFESPKLLMLSGIGPADHVRAHGIAPVADLPGVGQNLQDHLQVLLYHRATSDPGQAQFTAEAGLFEDPRHGLGLAVPVLDEALIARRRGEIARRREHLRQAVVMPSSDDDVTALVHVLGASASAPEAPGAGLKKRLFTAIQRLLLARAARHPLVILVEDLHWIDPTSGACLAAIAELVRNAPILLATTHRPGYRLPWAPAPHVFQLRLSPLSDKESLSVIRGVLDLVCSSDLERRIQARAEGNPLFLEELSRSARERGDGSLPTTIPAAIEDIIEGRLARLRARPRRLIAAAAVIGRDVPLPLLREVAELSDEAVSSAVAALERADFLSGGLAAGGEARRAFKHALVQETAYAKLAAAERRRLHRRALDAIERIHAVRIADHVERLAHHAMLGGAHERAIHYLLQAGRKAMGSFALAEAESHVERGLALLPSLAEGPERDGQELALHVALGMVRAAGRGPAAPDTARAFARALELRARVPAFAQVGTLLVGQWYGSLLRAEYAAAQDIAVELTRVAERDRDRLLTAAAHQTLGMTALYRGEFATVRAELEQALALYSPEEHQRRVVSEHGWPLHVNQRVTCLAYLGRALSCLGYPDQALARNREAVAEARAWGGALNMAVALGMLTAAHVLRRDMRATRETGEQTAAYASEWGIAYWATHGTLLRSLGERAEAPGSAGTGTDEIQQGLRRYRATGTKLGLTWFLTLLAEAHAASGEPAAGLAAVEEARALADATGERYHEAEIERVTGLLVLAGRDAGAVAAAERHFLRALSIAREQRARAWELRAAIDLARLRQGQGKTGDARDVLAPVSAWFTEGLDLPDLREARTLLQTIAAR